MKAAELSRVLNQQIEALCRYLLPNGRRKQFDWVAGDLRGGKGDSLKIRINAEDANRVGIWSDFATGESGKDVLDLWMAVRGCGLKQAMREASNWAGIVMEGSSTKPSSEYNRPPKPRCHKPETTTDWLLSRGLTEETIQNFKLAETQDGEIVFPYIKDGQFLNAKYRKLPKTFRQEGGAEPCLFGWQAIEKRFPNERYVVITEGELDAMSISQIGFPALSVPMGGGGGKKQDWIYSDFDDLAAYDRIYLCLDADKAGTEATDEIVRRLGESRCMIVELPFEFKDANEWLLGGMTKEDFQTRMMNARSRDPSELKSAQAYTEQVIQVFEGEDLSKPPQGVKMPWNSWDRDFRARNGETTLLGGYNGHGKSALISNIMAHSLANDERWCVASMEMQPRRTLHRLVMQMLNKQQPQREEVIDLLHSVRQNCWIFDVLDTAKADRMLEVFAYAAKRYDIRNFVIDSLAKCGVDDDKDSPNAQKRFVEKLCEFNHKYDSHIWLLSHTRKGESERIKPHKMDIKGSGAITDLVENVMFCWRDKDAEANGLNIEGVVQVPTAYVYIEKQRNYQYEGELPLYYDTKSMRYFESLRECQAQFLPRGVEILV